jgi:hypothetical protein
MLLMNLLTNAFKYNKSEAPRVDITFEPKGRKLHILFEDNGIDSPDRRLKKFSENLPYGSSENMTAKEAGWACTWWKISSAFTREGDGRQPRKLLRFDFYHHPAFERVGLDRAAAA